MREFDLQVKVIADFERQELARQGEETDHSENSSQDREYLKAVNQRIQKDLLNIREVFRPAQDASQVMDQRVDPARVLGQQVERIEALIQSGFSKD